MRNKQLDKFINENKDILLGRVASVSKILSKSKNYKTKYTEFNEIFELLKNEHNSEMEKLKHSILSMTDLKYIYIFIYKVL